MILNKFMLGLGALAVVALLLVGCSATPDTQSDKEQLHSDATAAFNNFKQTDSSLEPFLKDAFGYAVFPTIGKGGAGIGGAYGHAEVYQQGQRIGYADMTQATIGLQLGGQSFAELIVFQNQLAMENFKSGNFAFAANASAVAATAGAASTAKYDNGVAVFVNVNGGLMAEAVIGGQKFSYAPLQ